jgi:hypothetical protein
MSLCMIFFLQCHCIILGVIIIIIFHLFLLLLKYDNVWRRCFFFCSECTKTNWLIDCVYVFARARVCVCVFARTCVCVCVFERLRNMVTIQFIFYLAQKFDASCFCFCQMEIWKHVLWIKIELYKHKINVLFVYWFVLHSSYKNKLHIFRLMHSKQDIWLLLDSRENFFLSFFSNKVFCGFRSFEQGIVIQSPSSQMVHFENESFCDVAASWSVEVGLDKFW